MFHMKRHIISITLLLCGLTTHAQEQTGMVKTIGRPGQPGAPVENVMIRVQGAANATLSDSSGCFNLVLAHYEIGQAYSLSRVSKMGYRLVDEEVIGRKYPYSDEIPLEISMVSNEVYNSTKSEIESKVRARIEEEYQRKFDQLQNQLEAKTISEEKHIQELCELNDYYDKSENLINKLADRYARIDYDRLDSLDIQISLYIEQGKLEEAEALIQSKGTRQALENLQKSNLQLEKSLEDGRKAEARLKENYAAELMTRFDIASLRFDNVTAASLLKERMELDTTRVMWKMDYALFIQEYLGQYEEAMAIYKEVAVAENHPSVYDCIGNLYQQLGDYENALEAYKTSSELRIKDSIEGRGLAQNYHNIAILYLSKNQYDSALEYLKESRLIYEDLGDSLGISSIERVMADYYTDNGQYDKAVSCLRNVVKIQLEEYGEGHKKVANSYWALAQVLRVMGNNEESYELVNKAKEIYARIFGERHPTTASTYLLLGSLAMDVDEYGKALLLYQKAIDIFIGFYSETHPEVAASYNKLAVYYYKVECNYEMAVSYFSKSKEIIEKIYGKDHSDVASILINLGVCYSKMHLYEDAYNCYMESLRMRQNMYSDSHISIAELYNNLANVSFNLGRFDEGIKMMEQALPIIINHYGERHRKVVIAYNNLGSMYSDQKEYAKAIDCLSKAKSIMADMYGSDNIMIATISDNIADVYQNQKRYDEAEALALEALEIRLNKLGENHLDTALSLNNLALLYQSMGKFEQAEEYIKRSLNIKKDISGENSYDVALAYSNMSTIYRDMQQYDRSLEYAEKALDITAELYGWDHTDTMVHRFGVAECYSKMQRYDDAIYCFSSLYHDMMAKEGSGHNYTQRFFIELHKAYNAVMGQADYDGRYKDDYVSLSRNSIVVAQVEDNSPASRMGLSGEYYVIEFEEWSLDQEDNNFFVFNSSVISRNQKTYVLYKDDEFFVVPFEDKLGVRLGYRWISSEDKLELIKTYHKWTKKR